MKKLTKFIAVAFIALGVLSTAVQAEIEEVVVTGTRTTTNNTPNSDLVNMDYSNSPGGSMSANQLSMGYSGKAEYEKKKSLEIARQQCKAQAAAQFEACRVRASNFLKNAIDTCKNYRYAAAVVAGGGAALATAVPLAGALVGVGAGGLVYVSADNCATDANYQFTLETQHCDSLRENIEKNVCENIK